MKKYKLICASVLLSMATAASANQVVKLIIPTGAGGGTDSLFRALARHAEPHLNSTIVTHNIGGAGGTIGISQLARSTPDGKTIAGVWMGPITVAPHTVKTSYTPDDYVPVIYIDEAPYVLCVRSDFPAENGKEMLDQLKAKPGEYTYGTDGVAGPGQLAAERVFQSFGIKARDVPYRGAGETMPALLGKVIDIYVGSVPIAAPMEKAGNIKCLLATGTKPVASLPRATTLTELGIPEKETLLWHAIVAPAGTPDGEVEKIADAFEKAADAPEMVKFFETAGVEKRILRRQEFKDHITKEYADLGKLVKDLNLQPQ